MSKQQFIDFYTQVVHNDPILKASLAATTSEAAFMSICGAEAAVSGHVFNADDVRTVLVDEMGTFVNWMGANSQAPAMEYDGQFFNPLATPLFSIHEDHTSGTCHC